MADIYKFSQSSFDLLEKCIAAASDIRIDNNKWIELFKPNMMLVAENIDNCSTDESTILWDTKTSVKIDEDLSEQQTAEFEMEDVENIRANLEASPSNSLNYLTEQSNYEHLLPSLAEKLTTPCIERICNALLINHGEESEKILLHFFPVYINRETSEALNLLVQTCKSHPDTVISLVRSLFMNTDIPYKVLEEFFIAIDEKTRSRFLLIISNYEIPAHVFIHHLNTVHSLYKSNQKSLEIQNFVLKGLSASSQLCRNYKDYGRLLLTFLQGLTDTFAETHRALLEQILEAHETPFKGPCHNILRKLL